MGGPAVNGGDGLACPTSGLRVGLFSLSNLKYAIALFRRQGKQGRIQFALAGGEWRDPRGGRAAAEGARPLGRNDRQGSRVTTVELVVIRSRPKRVEKERFLLLAKRPAEPFDPKETRRDGKRRAKSKLEWNSIFPAW